MNDSPNQCGSTEVHLPHEDCPGLTPPPYEGRRRATVFCSSRMPADPQQGCLQAPDHEGNHRAGSIEWDDKVCGKRTLTGDLTCVLPATHTGLHTGGNPRVQWSDTQELDSRPMMEQLAEREADPIRAWMLAYPGENTTGPGWGDDADEEAGRCCPTCRASLTDHNTLVHEAGYQMGVRHTLDSLQRATTEPVATPLARAGVLLPEVSSDDVDPWRDRPTYDQLEEALREVQNTISTKAGRLSRDEAAEMGARIQVLLDGPVPSFPQRCAQRPGAAHVRIPPGVDCDLRPQHTGPHHVWWQDGHGEATVTWEA